MNAESSSTDWDGLIQKHLDGLTSREEAAALSSRIVEDAAVRSRYLRAAQIHGALADEVLSLDLERDAVSIPQSRESVRRFAWPKQLAAGLVTGALVGLLGVGVVHALSTPKSEISSLPVANGGFENSKGHVDLGFPAGFGRWSGNPAEVVEEADGNRVLRLLETGNVKGAPNGGATGCVVFQLVDLSSLRRQWEADSSEAQVSLTLSARFRRNPARTDAEFPKLRAGCRIILFQTEPESIGEQWPTVTNEATGSAIKNVKIEPNGEFATISASCLLDSEATVALISVSASVVEYTTTPAELGGYFVDDVQLSAIRQPVLPVRYVK